MGPVDDEDGAADVVVVEDWVVDVVAPVTVVTEALDELP